MGDPGSFNPSIPRPALRQPVRACLADFRKGSEKSSDIFLHMRNIIGVKPPAEELA